MKQLGFPRNIGDVVNAAKKHDGVVIFTIEWVNHAREISRHSMIAVRTTKGVRFADYGGKFISDLGELSKRGGDWLSLSGYSVGSVPGLGQMVLVPGLKVIGALERYAGAVFKAGMLALEGVSAIETPQGVDLAFPIARAAGFSSSNVDPEVVQQSFQAFRARAQGGVPPRLSSRPRAVPRIDQLTGVQYRLNILGFGAGPVDGILGPKTKKAIIEFQETYKLKADGIPGPKTQAKLSEASSES